MKGKYDFTKKIHERNPRRYQQVQYGKISGNMKPVQAANLLK
jgi:hypothetical protein